MIPKTIHYCWFGQAPLPDEYIAYINSWKKMCPECEIIEWNESNFDINQNMYCREAYKQKKWAFVSDYARLKIIYDHGGIYLDTDVEVIKSLDALIKDGNGFIGFQNEEEVNTGLGFAAPKGNACVKKMLEMYSRRHFVSKSGEFDLTPCPVSNTVALKELGLKTGKACYVKQRLNGITVYPPEFFNPISPETMKMTKTSRTYTIHHYSGSWTTSKKRKLKFIFGKYFGSLLEKRAIIISRIEIKKFEQRISRRSRGNKK